MLRTLLVSLMLMVTTVAYAGSKEEKIAELNKQLNAEKGNVVYLDFWASWCIPCRKSFPWMNNMVDKYQGKGLTVISVNLDADKLNAEQFLAEFPANFSVIYDAKGYLGRKFKLPGMPSSMLFDRTGKLVATHVGFNQKKQAQFEQEIISLLTQ